MRVAVVTEVGDTLASAAADTQGSVAALVQVGLVVAIVEPGLAGLGPAMAGGITHLESQLGAMAAMAAMAATGKDTTQREPRVEATFMVPVQGHKVESLPNSLLVRQITPVAIMSREINPGLVSRANPASSNAAARPQKLQLGLEALGHGRM